MAPQPQNLESSQLAQSSNLQCPSGQYSPVTQQKASEGYSQQQYYQQFPQQSPIMQQPMLSKRKRWHVGSWGIVLFVILFLAACGEVNDASSSTSSNLSNTTTTSTSPTQKHTTVVPTPVPTKAPVQKWTTTHTFSGNGIKKTDSFTVADTWKLNWKCDPTSFDNMQFNLIVGVDPTDGSIGDPAAINTMCSPKNTHDTTTEHSGGNIYLDVNSEGSWTLEVQELK